MNVLKTEMINEMTGNKSFNVSFADAAWFALLQTRPVHIQKPFYLSIRLVYMRRSQEDECLMLHRARASKKRCGFIYINNEISIEPILD